MDPYVAEDIKRKKEREFGNKSEEINAYLDRIEELEDTIVRLEALIPEEDDKNKSRKKKVMDSKLAIELDERNKKIRKLKDRIGFLIKENVQLRKELYKIKSTKKDSSIIRPEDLRSKPPLNELVKELQDKVIKQRSLINNLKTKNGHLETQFQKIEKEKQLLGRERLRLEQDMLSLRNEIEILRDANGKESPLWRLKQLVPANIRDLFSEILENFIQIILSTQHLKDQSLQDVKIKVSNLLEDIKEIERKLPESTK